MRDLGDPQRALISPGVESGGDPPITPITPRISGGRRRGGSGTVPRARAKPAWVPAWLSVQELAEVLVDVGSGLGLGQEDFGGVVFGSLYKAGAWQASMLVSL